MAHNTTEAHEYVHHLDHAGKIAGSPRNKTQKRLPQLLLRDAIQKRHFTIPIAARASKPLDRSLGTSMRKSCLT